MKESRVHIGQKMEDLGFDYKVIPKAPKFKNQNIIEDLKLPEKVQQELGKLGFDYHRLKKEGTALNKYLTLLYEQIDLPHSSGQKYKDQILLLIGIGNPQDSQKAAIDYIYATYIRINVKTGYEKDLLAVTFNSKDGKIPSKEHIPGKMERLIREAEIGKKFSIGKSDMSNHNKETTNSTKVKRL